MLCEFEFIHIASCLIPLSHLQLLQDDRCLLIIETSRHIEIYLEQMNLINTAVKTRRPKKSLQRANIDGDFLTAFDEAKRLLVLCAHNKVLCGITNSVGRADIARSQARISSPLMKDFSLVLDIDFNLT